MDDFRRWVVVKNDLAASWDIPKTTRQPYEPFSNWFDWNFQAQKYQEYEHMKYSCELMCIGKTRTPTRAYAEWLTYPIITWREIARKLLDVLGVDNF